MLLLFIFLLGIIFNYILQCVELILQWFQMWVSVKVSILQVKINKLVENEQQGQETFAVGFHYSEPEQEYSYDDGEEFED